MANWDAMVSGEEGSGDPDAPASTRVLDQSEIDSLLGVDQDGGGGRRLLGHHGDRQLRPGVLRAPADARGRVRPPGAHDVHIAAQLHLG